MRQEIEIPLPLMTSSEVDIHSNQWRNFERAESSFSLCWDFFQVISGLSWHGRSESRGREFQNVVSEIHLNFSTTIKIKSYAEFCCTNCIQWCDEKWKFLLKTLNKCINNGCSNESKERKICTEGNNGLLLRGVQYMVIQCTSIQHCGYILQWCSTVQWKHTLS